MMKTEEIKPEESEMILPEELTHHPKNAEMYGEIDPSERFVDDVRENGVEQSIVVTDDSHYADGVVILSGHKRTIAADRADQKVPIGSYKEYETPEEEWDAIIRYNDYRDKTFSQKMGEGDAIKVIAEGNAKERMLATQNNDSGAALQNFAGQDGGLSRDEVAERIKIGSGETYRKAKKVWDASKDGDRLAEELVEKLDEEEESIHGAYTEYNDAQKEDEDSQEEEEEESENQSSQSDSKASDTGTQTEEGSDEGEESYNDDSDSEGIDGVPAHAEDKIPDESTATTTSTSESGVSDETETDSTGDDDSGSRTGPFGKPLKDESDGNDDSEPEKVTAVRESTGEKVGAGKKEEIVGSIEEITPPDEPSESDLENIKSKTENLIGDLPDDIEDNLKERSKELLDLWEAHINMASYAHNLRCPVCGDDSLEYTCHHIKPDEALSLANQAYENHLEGEEELKGTDYEDVAAEERGFEGKEQTPSFEQALKN